MTAMKTTGALLAVLAFAGCGSGMDGTWTDPLGTMTYTFEGGRKVYVSVMGMQTELEYEVSGKRVKIVSPQGNQVLTRLDDGSLQGPLGLKLVRRKN